MTYKAAVVGAAGFAGIELVRVLLDHPAFDLVAATSDSNAGQAVAQAYPALAGRTEMRFSRTDQLDPHGLDAVFLAVPHTASLSMTPALLDAGASVIDLSADYRLKDAGVYEKWYGVRHTSAHLLGEAAFGLPELFEDDLRRARKRRERREGALVACAGCYPTATSLAAAPAVRRGMVRAESPIIVDAISGVTGAGKSPSAKNLFCFANEDAQAYGVATHRHTPEMEQILGCDGRIVFTPHLAPMNRGLLSTVSMQLAPEWIGAGLDGIRAEYAHAYADCPFVTVLDAGAFPKTSAVAGTNRAMIGLGLNESAGVLIAVSAIDNLGKGAAHQAVQCANAVFGLPQTQGLGATALPI